MLLLEVLLFKMGTPNLAGGFPAVILAGLERSSGLHPWEIFDLMYGTSTGSILNGMLANKVPAEVMSSLYINQGKKLFTKNAWYRRFIGGPKYDKRTIQIVINKYLDI